MPSAWEFGSLPTSFSCVFVSFAKAAVKMDVIAGISLSVTGWRENGDDIVSSEGFWNAKMER